MNPAILHKDVQDFIARNYKLPIPEIVLKGSPFKDITVQELAIQLQGKKKAEKKLPGWFEKNGIIYPPGLNIEQTSSEDTAAYKAALVEGKSMVDITGGFGIDSVHFSGKFKKVVHCEINEELSAIAKHNSGIFGTENIQFFCGNGIDFLSNSTEKFDWIYVDPSRRDEIGERVFHLSDCLPDVPKKLELLFEKSSNILIKTSPLLDLSAGISALKNIAEIHILAVKNEVKELLWILKKGFSGNIKLSTINLKRNKNEFYKKEYPVNSTPEYNEPLSYLYEPNAAIMKSGLFNEIATDFQLKKLHPNTHLYTSEDLKDFPGRCFKISNVIPYNKKIKSHLNFKKAHISVRNFPESVASLRKQLKLQDGGDKYLFFTTSIKNKKLLLICKKV